ncbi:hypothetical protein D623_10030767 [Myotis brandtii]|uniref:Uncharacterized protein n=1 Tax=Myotis brandtii TaxID=109478 RepID=S7MTB7_MYOBR|nr:hypothetical protein D623_10030767 [Myotis brandtii]
MESASLQEYRKATDLRTVIHWKAGQEVFILTYGEEMEGGNRPEDSYSLESRAAS